MRCGDTDPNKVYYRSDSRTFLMNGQWFFASREGDQGPFLSRSDADVELERHVEASQALTPLKSKGKADDVMALPDIAEAPVLQFHRKPAAFAGDGTMTDIADINNTSLRAYRERYS